MSISHGPISAPSPRQGMQRATGELIVKICTALLITFAATFVLVRAETYFSSPARVMNGETTAVEPDPH